MKTAKITLHSVSIERTKHNSQYFISIEEKYIAKRTYPIHNHIGVNSLKEAKNIAKECWGIDNPIFIAWFSFSDIKDDGRIDITTGEVIEDGVLV